MTLKTAMQSGRVTHPMSTQSPTAKRKRREISKIFKFFIGFIVFRILYVINKQSSDFISGRWTDVEVTTKIVKQDGENSEVLDYQHTIANRAPEIIASEQMTDFEINKKVAEQDGEKGEILDYEHTISHRIIDTKGDGEHSKVLNYQHTRSKRVPKITTSGHASGENTDNKVITMLHKDDEVKGESDFLDFAVVGFAKCGTTFLSHTLLHDVAYFGNKEGAEVHDLRFGKVAKFKDRYMNLSKKQDDRLFAFKAPETLQSVLALRNVRQHFPSTNFIITMRHPVKWFESFYNFRLRLANAKHLPPAERLIGRCDADCHLKGVKGCFPWYRLAKKVCTDGANFHRAISRLSLTPMDTDEEKALLGKAHKDLSWRYQGKVFLMVVEQMGDTNTTRQEILERDMEAFLGIAKNSLNALAIGEKADMKVTDPISYDNDEYGEYNDDDMNGEDNEDDTNGDSEQRKRRLKELGPIVTDRYIDICEPKYRKLRQKLVQNGKRASRWITKFLLKSDRVVISSPEYFLELISKWESDPCETK